MRAIERASAFKRDYKRVKAAPQHRKNMNALLTAILELLLTDKPLPVNNRDHALGGELADYRECHGKPDLLLIYGRPSSGTLRLVRLGSHSELFG